MHYWFLIKTIIIIIIIITITIKKKSKISRRNLPSAPAILFFSHELVVP